MEASHSLETTWRSTTEVTSTTLSEREPEKLSCMLPLEGMIMEILGFFRISNANSLVQFDWYWRDCSSAIGCIEDQASDKPRVLPRPRPLQDYLR